MVLGGLHVGEGLDLGMRSLEREDTVLWWYLEGYRGRSGPGNEVTRERGYSPRDPPRLKGSSW